MEEEVATERWTPVKEPAGEGGGPTLSQLLQRGAAAWERDEFDAALRSFREVLELRPDFPDVRNKVGLCRAMLGDVEGSLDDFDHAVRVNPGYCEAHLNRAIVLSELGRYEEAGEAFARAEESSRHSGENFPADLGNRIAGAHAQLGDLYMDASDVHRASEEYDRALEVRPGFLDIRSKRAHALMEMGKLERAKRELEDVVEANPFFLGARIRLGVVLHRMGETEQAVAQWMRCLAQNPRNRKTRAYLASVGRKDSLPVPEDREGAAEA